MARIDDQVSAIETMPAVGLRNAWQAEFGEAAPSLSSSLFRRALASAAQERSLGSLPAATRKILEAMAKADAPPPDPAIKLKPGTRLVREWNGIVHNVLIMDNGVMFGEQRYGSLSEVARAITGAHWFGPRFFGLKRPARPPASGAKHG
ncbi:DUF2924 domain-containing protein [Sphingomonas sp.]|jgi:hypothetical protein|uniref:DUF2924 domain-containing protein n=1 Tax=Sphingomonas sp. TaxID=28214 RepID=UPI002E34B1C5|nr:DUF2924 domain-containing protein [Sphingomonas sp.]HEX4694441.1 DUF2924 domain-containing protein [Sphingomonas sp.]